MTHTAHNLLISRVREWLIEAGLDAAYLTDPVTVAHLTGLRVDPFERLMAVAVTRTEATLVLPAIEQDKAAAAARGVRLAPWADGQDPYALVTAALSGAGTIAVEKRHISLEAAETLLARTGLSRLDDAGPWMRSLRRLKTEREIALLAEAAKITDDITERVMAEIRVGMTEAEIARRIDSMIEEAGARPSFSTIVLSGPNSALPHGVPGPRRLVPGDLVLIDFGAAHEGYCADTTRVAVVGDPDERQREMHDLVARAQRQAVATIRAGVTVGAVDAAARDIISDAGHGPLFFHRTGHGLGLQAHEEPNLDPGSDRVLEAGAVVTVEPGVYLPGWGGIRIEDDVVVEAGGARLLTTADRSLRVIPAN